MATDSFDDFFTAFYASVSGPAGKRNWALSEGLFHPDARMVRTSVDMNGKPVLESFSLDAYRANASARLATMDFYEWEIARKVLRFGNVAQVYSAYEAWSAPSGGKFIKRGMNFLHLFNDGQRWWIMHCMWDDERPGVALPMHIFES